MQQVENIRYMNIHCTEEKGYEAFFFGHLSLSLFLVGIANASHFRPGFNVQKVSQCSAVVIVKVWNYEEGSLLGCGLLLLILLLDLLLLLLHLLLLGLLHKFDGIRLVHLQEFISANIYFPVSEIVAYKCENLNVLKYKCMGRIGLD